MDRAGTLADALRRHRARSPPGTPSRRPTASPRLRIHALQPQQPALEVARQRLHRRPGRHASSIDAPEPDTAARRRRRPAPTRRAARRNNSTVRRARLRAAPTASGELHASPRSSGRPARAAPSRSTPRAPRSAARARRQTATAAAARPSPRRASCPDRGSGTPRSGRLRPACRCGGPARRLCTAARTRLF